MKNVEFPATELEARGYKEGDIIYLKGIYAGPSYNDTDIKFKINNNDTNYLNKHNVTVFAAPVCLRSGETYLVNGHKCMIVIFEGFVHCISDSGYAALLEEDDDIQPWTEPVVETPIENDALTFEAPIDPF